jgi:hypothetical protein
MVSTLSMTFKRGRRYYESMLSLRLRLQQLLWGRKYIPMYAFAYEPEPTVTQDCLGPRTNSGVPERSVLMGSGIVLVLLAWVGSFESGACVPLEAASTRR